MPINKADISNKENPRNSSPILRATNNEYNIAVVTPAHSKNLIKYKLSFFYVCCVFLTSVFTNIK